MLADKSVENSCQHAQFTIENNVLKGRPITYTFSYNDLGQLLFDSLKNNPNVIGQVDGVTEEEDTFAEMADRAIKCALWMQKQGVTKGDIITVSTHNHRDSLIPCIAALFLGATFNPWDYAIGTHMARYFMNLIEPKVIFANEQSVELILETVKLEKSHATVVCYGDYPGAISYSEVLSGHDKSAVANFRCMGINDPSQTATILFTSGTTGLPKGVQMSHRAWLIMLKLLDPAFLYQPVLLWFISLFWISGPIFSLRNIVSCTKTIISPKYSEKTVCELIQKFKVTHLMLATSMTNRLARYSSLDNYDLSYMEYLFTGGVSMNQECQDVIKKHFPKTKIIQSYAMTEFCGPVAAQLLDSSSGSCGIVCPNCEIKIIDPETGKTLGPNQNGELCAKTPSMMSGYYKNPEATKGTLDAEGFLHSGDLACYNEKGELFVIDRLTDIIKYRGRQVPPSEIENVLQLHPAVLEAAVVSIPHPTDGEHPVAFVSKIQNKEVTAQELIDLVANNLMDHYKLRGGVNFVPSLPRTHSTKVSRKELKVIAKTLAVS